MPSLPPTLASHIAMVSSRSCALAFAPASAFASFALTLFLLVFVQGSFHKILYHCLKVSWLPVTRRLGLGFSHPDVCIQHDLVLAVDLMHQMILGDELV